MLLEDEGERNLMMKRDLLNLEKEKEGSKYKFASKHHYPAQFQFCTL